MNGIKKDTIIKIARAAINQNGISREELSRLTGFSTMTLGKAVPSLIASGLFVERRATVSRGRHARLLGTTEQHLLAVSLCTAERTELVARSLCGDEEMRLTLSSDELNSPIRNTELAIAELFEKAEMRQRLAIYGTVLISPTDVHEKNNEAVFCTEELVANGISAKYPDKNVLHVHIFEDRLVPSFFSHTNPVSREGARDVYASNPGERANAIARLVAAIRELTVLHELIIEGYVQDESELVTSITDILTDKYGISRYALPSICYHGCHSFICDAAFYRLKEQLAERTFGAIFDE